VIRVDITSAPSSSKGWGRYALHTLLDGEPVVKSRTGNRWVSAGHEGEAAEGAALVLETQVMNRVGKGRTRREEKRAARVELLACAGAECDVVVGTDLAQGMRLHVTGARPAVEVAS